MDKVAKSPIDLVPHLTRYTRHSVDRIAHKRPSSSFAPGSPSREPSLSLVDPIYGEGRRSPVARSRSIDLSRLRRSKEELRDGLEGVGSGSSDRRGR